MAEISATVLAAPNSQILLEVMAERERQVSKLGYTAAHDDTHTDGELAMAAMAYLQSSVTARTVKAEDIDFWWPSGWSPMKRETRRAELVAAGALVLAEIERLDRLEPVAGGTSPTPGADQTAASSAPAPTTSR